jgi:nicotinate-nucleotide adenylyltransferase
MKKTGVFGGSFDPIHFGHIYLALQLLEIHHLDEVLFCPVFCSPFKLASPPIASPKNRLEMLHLAIDKIPKFKITSLEIDRGGPSFSIDTIRSLQSPERQLYLLFSEEVAFHLSMWKESETLLELAPPLIGSRLSSSSSGLKQKVTKTKVFDVSSTDIRKRLSQGLYCGHLVPQKSLDYIQSQGLYKR